MTFQEAIAAQPMWVGIWLNVLLVGAFILPLALLFWRQSRIAGIVTVLASVLAAVSITWLYGRMGYVKLLGLPHIVLWVPVVIYLIGQIRRADMPVWPQRIMAVVVATMVISLVFDVVDTARYVLGERTPMAGTLPE